MSNSTTDYDTKAFGRFMSFVELDDKSGCWLWGGCLYSNGYGMFGFRGKSVRAHRYAYERWFGKIPNGLQLDHLCRTKNCVKPTHLEPVTARQNVLRGRTIPAENAKKTHCKRGHEFTKENTYINKGKSGPRRQCKKCILMKVYESRSKRRAERETP